MFRLSQQSRYVAKKSLSDPNLSLRIEVAMYRRELSQADLARRLGVTRGTVSNWVSGRDEPGKKRLPALSVALGVSVEWLMGEPISDEERAWERELLLLLRNGGPAISRLIEQHGYQKVIDHLRLLDEQD